MQHAHPARRVSARLSLRLLGFLLTLPILFATQSVQAEAAPSLGEQLAARTYTDDLAGIKKRKTLRALVTFSRTDFFFTGDATPKGIQVEYLHHYLKFLNQGVKREEHKVRLLYIPTTFDRLIPDLLAGKGDVAAAMLTMTPEREATVAFASGRVSKVNELVVTHKKIGDIKKVEDLAGRKVYVLKGSSYAEHLRDLNQHFAGKKLKPMEIQEADSHLLSEDILELVNAGVVDITVVDDYKAKLWAQALPDIRVLENVAVKRGTHVGWAVRKDNPALLKHLNAFAKTVKKGTLMGNMLFNRYYKTTKWIDNPVKEAEREKLQEYIEVFKKFGAQYGFDYLAVAAQAYQESRLNHKKKSHRGAMGLMQLLPSTAADPNVDIPDIKSVENNVHAGVKYLAFLRDRYFSDPEISPEDRFALSWAAYNAGPGKVGQMRNKARKMGLDPNVWFSNVELAAGRIVGRETVQYVGNIFKYYVAYSLVKDQLKFLDKKPEK